MCQNKTGSTLQPEHPKHGGTSLEGGRVKKASHFIRKRKRFTALSQPGGPSSSSLLRSFCNLATSFGAALEGCIEPGPHPARV